MICKKLMTKMIVFISGSTRPGVTHHVPTAVSDGTSAEVKEPASTYNMLAESPAPPPPSPEPAIAGGVEARDDVVQTFARGFTGDLLSTVPNTEDKDDDTSQYTISAKPPSNLDDYSRINTPNSALVLSRDSSQGLHSRESTKAVMEVVTEEKESARTNDSDQPQSVLTQPILTENNLKKLENKDPSEEKKEGTI